jgi:hypothetical protein
MLCVKWLYVYDGIRTKESNYWGPELIEIYFFWILFGTS